jgi:hypothetical protein
LRKKINVYHTGNGRYQVDTAQSVGPWKEEPDLTCTEVVDRLPADDEGTNVSFLDGRPHTARLAPVPPEIQAEFYKRTRRRFVPADEECPLCSGTGQVNGAKCRCQV